jgi:acylphosphatase
MPNTRVRLVIEGRVQGVFFRDATRSKALSLGLSGWVKNRPDNTVEVLIEGSEEKVARLVSWCHQGPPAAKVTRVHKETQPWQGDLFSFEISF